MSLIGKKLPEFNLDAYDPKTNEFIKISDKDLEGKWKVLMFYPADFTFVCPTELEDLQEKYGQLKEMGAEVYSVSVDTHFVHKAWHDESEAIGKIQYKMIGDSNKELTKALDILTEDGKADRATFVIDPDNVIQALEINAGGIGRKAENNIYKVKAGQYVRKHPDQVCPAKWNSENDDTLTPGLDLVGKIWC